MMVDGPNLPLVATTRGCAARLPAGALVSMTLFEKPTTLPLALIDTSPVPGKNSLSLVWYVHCLVRPVTVFSTER